jgi:hypothetical protein
MRRYLNFAVVIAAASLVASCGLAPKMTAYPYPKYGFTADFPAPPEVEESTDAQSGVHVIAIDAKNLGRDFAITFSDVDPSRDIDALVEDASQAMAKAVGGTVTYRTYCATAEGVLGRELVISKNGSRAVRARYYLSGARFYILTAESVVGANPVGESAGVDTSTESGADNDPAVNVFLTSFHVSASAKS